MDAKTFVINTKKKKIKIKTRYANAISDNGCFNLHSIFSGFSGSLEAIGGICYGRLLKK